MAQQPGDRIDRRSFLLGSATIGASAMLVGCTGNDDRDAASSVDQAGNDKREGKELTIGFSAPPADHGWLAAINKNAAAQAEKYPEVTFHPTGGTRDVNLQISQVEKLLADGVDVLVIMPTDGLSLTEVGRKAMDAGVPVINLDRILDSPLAYRTFIGGDGYGMGAAAGRFVATTLKERGVASPVIAEIPGDDSLRLTQDRSRGFGDALAAAGLQVGERVPAEFTAESGERAAASLLQDVPQLDALWNHDDDQGLGVLSAIDAVGRDEFVMVGGGGSANAMRDIKADDTVLKATVTYSPSMAASAISVARLVGNGWGIGDLVEADVPSSITVASATVTKGNVDRYMPLAYES